MEPPSFKHLRPDLFNKLDDKKQLESLEKLTQFHIDSFDWMIDQGLRHAIKRIPPIEFTIKNGSRVSYKIIVRIIQSDDEVFLLVFYVFLGCSNIRAQNQ